MSRLLVTQYQAEVEKIIRYGGSKKETSIRNAFERLLNDYCKPQNYMLIPELDFKTKFNTTVFPDGTVKDAIRLEHGWWESKDQYDKLDEEIEKKFAKGYPDENILFEDSQTAVLIQHSQEVARVSMKDAEALDRLLQTFVEYERAEVRDFRAAIAKFKEDIPHILPVLRDIITQQEESNTQFRERRNTFLEVCRQSINPEIEIFDIHEMLIQHILTEDIFTNIFHESQFHRENNIARELSEIINTFFTGATRKNTLKSIEHYYAVIRRKSENIVNHHEKQKFLKAIYENFYKAYNPKAADRLGIVYTPNEIVRFMIESTDYLVHKHFGKLLSDPGVEILDPCTGTGTYVTELIEYLPADKLEHKYKHEIHCNEVAILPYYIANLNIEFTYQQKMGEYEEFKNICLVDTLDHCGFEGKQFDLFAMSVQNTARIQEQNSKTISVIIGNPPYNAWQANFSQDNANRSYSEIDKRIKATYIKFGTAQNQIAIYDMYTRFLRWASDRLGENGIVSFVSNSSFIDSKAYDGFRKAVAQEFSEMWIIDMKGNARTTGERRRKEGGNVFSDEIRVGIAVYLLVRKEKAEGFKVFYNAIDDYVDADDKKQYFSSNSLTSLNFDHITPDQKANWINLTDNDFESFLPLIDKEVKAGRSQEAVFQLFSAGVKTQRDEWVYDFSKEALIKRMKYFVEVYGDRLENGVRRDLDIKWDPDLEKHLENKIPKRFEISNIRSALYRHFGKVYFYFDRHFNGRTYRMFNLFPNANSENKLIGFMGQSAGKPFCILSTNLIPDLNCISPASGGTQCLSLYRYDENGNRIDNITDWALEQFRNHYGNELSQTRGLSPLLPEGELPLSEARGLSPLFSEREGCKQFWFVTFVTHNSRVSERMMVYGVEGGEPLIFSAEDQIFIAERIAEAAKRYGIEIVGFNVLPDHVHMVVAAETEKELNENIRKIKGFSSHQFQRSHNWDKGQHIWAQKFNRQPIEDENALTEILEYVWNNHIKHTERWGEELISTWETGLPNKGLKPLVEIVRDGCTAIETILNPEPGTRGLSPLPEQTQNITKLDIFHYTYAVLHHPAYRTKYELNLKREFPRLPFYADFHQWVAWGKTLMELHLTYETIEPYGLRRVDIGRNKATRDTPLQGSLIATDPPDPPDPAKPTTPKAKLKADKIEGKVILDTDTTLEGVPAVAWDYKLGNRSALEWILDQHKEKKPRDPTIREKFNTYKFADYKEHVIELLDRVCTVSVKTMEIIQQMPDTVEHQKS
ncbi:MAG: type ISP restriction/modification enzyme [Elainellaceae cyanobacterium]